ncbi:MAG: alkaline phosphatase family protein [Phycisphaerales bacterium]|nr:MAG: alkaline phosphatase family protein [Phycisphaerales bacterium]
MMHREGMSAIHTPTGSQGRGVAILRRGRNMRVIVTLAVLCVLLAQEPAHAYIGPGAGIAVGSSLLALFLAFLSGFAAFFLWPIRWLFRFIRGRRAHAKARVKRFVILGLDGMEPTLAEKYMSEGKMPNLAKLKREGTYRRLGTTAPPLSPVAWSTFLTGCNPGKHNIFDFLTRIKSNYLPSLSSVSIHDSSRALKLGKYRIPLGKPDIRLLRKGKPFWNTLGEHGIFSNIIRVPITFPPEKFNGVLLSAMCVPDLRGSQGTFSYYTTRAAGEGEHVGGEQIRVKREGDVIRSHLVGPAGGVRDNGGPMRCPFEVKIRGKGKARLKVNGETVELNKGEYTPWVGVEFKAGLGVKVKGICEFLLLNTEPEFELYVTPIQIDPDKPVMPISHPSVYCTYLSKMLGTYATLGLAEDTWGLNAGILGDDDFLHQCLETDEEREEMFFDALEKVRRGLCVCVFDGTDRIQHMFWRYIDPEHPARNGQAKKQHRNAIDELYQRMDELVGRTVQQCKDDGTVLMVISDHGFKPFRRGIDLNVWLEQNGYLKLKPDGRGKKYLTGIDWSQTKAYCMGLAGIWLNVKGREAQGIVEPGDADKLREELCEKLTGLRDEENNELAISRAFDTRKIYSGPYKTEAPDIILGYNVGYRVSWEAAVGQPTDKLFHDNTRAWSGDHCIDPKLVPGVLFCNRKIKDDNPRLIDLGATALDMFGVEVPKIMDGRPLTLADANGAFPTNGRSKPGIAKQSPDAAKPKKDNTCVAQ